MKTDHAHSVLLCLASNVEQKRNMEAARILLSELIADFRYTSEHWTEPVTSHGDRHAERYLNQLATGRTELSVEVLNQCLKEIEQQLGRKHDKSGVVTIDIDLLLYDETRYHLRDWERNYVKDLLVEL
ncbi:MAG: 2-amino-4-hydroxy-6-hydroxymethyldihydropteridine diphosphokinase [Prevotella sp.]|nr:2-amino-4-hydroxy-6-hydroxymethyldihydropteridine diphosphokinase [Prevotella sp.]